MRIELVDNPATGKWYVKVTAPDGNGSIDHGPFETRSEAIREMIRTVEASDTLWWTIKPGKFHGKSS